MFWGLLVYLDQVEAILFSLDSPSSVLKMGVTFAFFKSLGSLSDLSKRIGSGLAAIRTGPLELWVHPIRPHELLPVGGNSFPPFD